MDGGRGGGRDEGMGGALETHHDLFPWMKQSATPSVFPPKAPFALLSCDSLRRDAFLDVYLFAAQKAFTLQGNNAPQ